jgi:hypothetical protein
VAKDAEGAARASAESVTENVGKSIETALQRFEGATAEMRRIAADMSHELSETREEMRRGIFDLPEETRESTNAMRRAVSEQINALKDLSRIVENSGRAFDLGNGDARRQRKPAPPQQAPQPAMRQPAPAPAAPVQRDPAVREPAMREPAMREPALRGSFEMAEAAPEQPSGGWVSDLLRRASKDDEEPAPRAPQRVDQPREPLHTVESLNSLSVDIARAIDHEASIDLWDRYRRGERNVFTRRLYTLKGQQTFDEIKRKYENDSTFRASVDRYISDFERLLRDIAKNDRDNIMTQTYLTSDTGKVYTMLAHAAGKLR